MARENAVLCPHCNRGPFVDLLQHAAIYGRQGPRRRPPRACSKTRQRGEGRKVRNDGPVQQGGFR